MCHLVAVPCAACSSKDILTIKLENNQEEASHTFPFLELSLVLPNWLNQINILKVNLV